MKSRGRARKTSIVFMTVWLIVWMGGMMVVTYSLGAAVLRGELMAILMLGGWLLVASFGLYKGAKELKRLLSTSPGPPRSKRDHPWHDGVSQLPEDPENPR